MSNFQLKYRALEPEDATMLFLWENDLEINEVNKVILPVSSFQKLLTNDDLIQVNNYKPSKKNSRNFLWL